MVNRRPGVAIRTSNPCRFSLSTVANENADRSTAALGSIFQVLCHKVFESFRDCAPFPLDTTPDAWHRARAASRGSRGCPWGAGLRLAVIAGTCLGDSTRHLPIEAGGQSHGLVGVGFIPAHHGFLGLWLRFRSEFCHVVSDVAAALWPRARQALCRPHGPRGRRFATSCCTIARTPVRPQMR